MDGIGGWHRREFLATADANFGGVIRHDFTTGGRDTWDPGAARHSGEWLFVPGTDRGSDDDGWLLSYVHDEATATTDLVVIDATDVQRGPVASVRLPQRVPYGFHATWLPPG